MALSNLSKDKMLNIKDLIDSYTTLYKKDMILVNLLGKNFNFIITHCNNVIFITFLV